MAKVFPYCWIEHKVPELILMGSQPAGDRSHKPRGRLPLLSTRPSKSITIHWLLPIILLGDRGTCVPVWNDNKYLSDLLHRVSDITSRRRLRSSTSSELVIPLSRLVTVGDRSFAVAGPRLWNTLPEDITSAPSLLVFRRKLKTHLFRQSYPDIIL